MNRPGHRKGGRAGFFSGRERKDAAGVADGSGASALADA